MENEIKETLEIYTKAIMNFGEKNQMIVAMEECSELIKEISKILRGKGDIEHLAEEMADVDIMIDQLVMIFYCADLVVAKRREKLKRLKELVNESEENENN